eukprot:6172528-Pleurochrysis_carterae.AAC.1
MRKGWNPPPAVRILLRPCGSFSGRASQEGDMSGMPTISIPEGLDTADIPLCRPCLDVFIPSQIRFLRDPYQNVVVATPRGPSFLFHP